jgi:hypothetical protein
MAQDDRLVQFPVTCPICSKARIAEYRRADVVGALLNDRAIRLYAPCCDKTWTAGYVEMQQIRAHFDPAPPDDPGRSASAGKRQDLED